MRQNFSIDYGDIGNCLPIDIFISNPDTNETKCFTAIIDTGATNTVISQKVFCELKLDKAGIVRLSSANESSNVSLTAINVILPNNISFYDLEVTVCNLPDDVDALIGMDIITQGDLSVTNYEKTVLEFETPALRPCGCSE